MTSSGHKWLIGVGTALVSAGLGWCIAGWQLAPRFSQPTPPQEARATAGDVATLRRELDRLRGEMARLSADAAVASVDAGGRQGPPSQNRRQVSRAAHSEVGDTAAEPTSRQAARREAAASRMKEDRASLETEFRAEPRDPDWAAQAASTITRAWTDSAADQHYAGSEERDSLAGSRLRQMDCRATTCRVEVAHEDDRALMAFLHNFPSKVGAVLPYMTVEPADGPPGVLTTVVYLTR